MKEARCALGERTRTGREIALNYGEIASLRPSVPRRPVPSPY